MTVAYRWGWIPVWVGMLAAGAAPASPPGHGFHPPMPDQSYRLICTIGNGDAAIAVDAKIQLVSPSLPADLDQTVELPEGLPAIHLKQYLPKATLEQSVALDESGQAGPALEVSIEGPAQSLKRWLIAADPIRNRLTSFIGTWRFMAVDDAAQRDALFEQFRDEFTRDPILMVQMPAGATAHLPAKVGARHDFGDAGTIIEVKAFFPHFGIDKATEKPVNQSDIRLNPAALVEIQTGDQREERWVFAKFTDFQAHQDVAQPVKIKLDCPIAKKSTTPDFMLLQAGQDRGEVWTRHAGATSSGELKLDQTIAIAGTQYVFRITRMVASGHIRDEYRPATERGGVTALRFETVDVGGEKLSIWLETGKQHVVETAKGLMVVRFDTNSSPTPGGHP